MDEIEKILEVDDPKNIVERLKQGRTTELPDVEKAIKSLDIKKHDVNDKSKRPDKQVKVDDGGDGAIRTERVARIAVAIQKLIIKRGASFLFGTPPIYKATPQGEDEEMVYKALKRILHDTKSTSINKRIARAVFGFKECAELWFPIEKEHSTYGFNSKSKLRCTLFSPAFGDILYPYFDKSGDMIAFSREFSRLDGGKTIKYFETYTDKCKYLWEMDSSKYELCQGFPKVNPIGKIPVVYAYQDYFETEDIDDLIARLEKLLSNFADTNDYHASPKIFTTGQIVGWSKKGEAGAVIEGEEGATAQYLAWSNAPESVKLEIETLLKLIYTISQTPDISFESVKGLGAISGVALKLLFMDAHLKVNDKREIFDEYLQRRCNIIKAYIGEMNNTLQVACDTLEVEPEIVPYMLADELGEVNMWMTANGNKPLISQKASVVCASLTQDPEKDFEQIKEEASLESSFSIGEHVIDA